MSVAAEQDARLLRDDGALDLAISCMASLYNEGRPEMLLEEHMVRAQKSLVSIILESAEASGSVSFPTFCQVVTTVDPPQASCWVAGGHWRHMLSVHILGLFILTV